MRVLVFGCLLAGLAVMFMPSPCFASAPSRQVTLEFPRVLQRLVDNDPSTQKFNFVLVGGDSLRIDRDNIHFLFDEEAPRGLVYVSFRATSELESELAKFKSWNWKRALNGFYRAKAGERSIQPEVSVTIVFRNPTEYNEYLEGFESPLLGRVIYEP